MKARSTFVLLLAAVFVSFTETARSQPFQKALDTTTTSIGMVGGITSTTDGGYIMVLNTDSGDVQWKADATGQALWAKHYSVGSATRARMPDGGIVFCDDGTYEQGTGGSDSSHAHLRVARSDANGDVEWSKFLTIPILFTSQDKTTLQPVISTDAVGHILISTSVGGGQGGTKQWFVSLTAFGALLWSRLYPLDVDARPLVVASDGNAGWFFAFDDGLIFGEFRLGHLSFLGTIQWYNSFTYNWLGASVRVGALTAVNGQAVVGGEIDANVGPWFIMKANFDGSLAWYTAYSGGVVPITRIGSLPSGELIASGGYPQFGIEAVIHTAIDGTLLNSVRPDTIVDTQYLYTSTCWDLDLRDTSLALSSYLIQKDFSMGTYSYRPAILRLSPANIAGCLTTPVVISSTEVQPSVVQVQALPSLIDIPTVLTIMDSVVTVVPIALISTHDYCSFITAVPEVQRVGIGFHVIENAVEQGATISCTSKSYGFLEVLDVAGQHVASMRISAEGVNELTTSGWRGGLYLLRATDAQGRSMGTAKVVVE